MLKMTAAGLFVTDMERMVSFYRDVMGMETEWDKSPNAELYSGDMRLIMYGRDDFEKMTSRIFGYPKGINGTVELAFDVPAFEDVDREYKRAVEAGAEPVLPPVTEPWGQRTSYVADPEGNLIEIGSFGSRETES
ncbi:VOC family protein [Anaerostipes sp.]|uniref:VOC family protein n=1 Tax=Anaerostipes sp. TaxID=1872530 RepID=UPI0025BB6288|nr:VOC family protein [Anaerostipes sp.]MBS7007626.1 VOC family protein [Anaerostipes sp.]